MHLDGKFGISKDDTSYRDKEAGSEVFQFHHSSWSLGSFFLVVIQWLSHVWPFETPWTAVLQASLSLTISWSSLRLMSIESVMPSNHLTLCHRHLLLPSILPSIRVFSKELALLIRWLNSSGGDLASASVLPMNVQGWFPLGWIGLTWSFHLCLKLKIEIVCHWEIYFLLLSANFTSRVKFL